jgi:murein DD-endopeptidase MepM/ murein hydrolase activator NlpD
MAKEFYTLIIVPHAKARFRKLHVSVRFTKWLAWTLGVGSLLLCGILVHYARMTVELWQLRELRAQNSTLLAKTEAYEKNAGRLQERIGYLQRLVTKLGVMAGLEQTLPDQRIGGVGGVPSLESVAPSLEFPPLPLDKLEREVSALTERSEVLEKFYKDQSTLLASTPSTWPVRGYLSAVFGNRKDPFTGQPDFHSGIDISTPRGTKVHAPADGVVVSCRRQGGYGNAIIIDHQHGIVTRYAHLDGFNVRPGQRVRRGDVIGFVGSTGKSTAPHLHYEVWVRDQAQNPIQFILDEYRSFG